MDFPPRAFKRGKRNSEVGQDGLTPTKRLSLLKKAVKMRFPITDDMRQQMVEECHEAMLDVTHHPFLRMKAAQILVSMEAMNQRDEFAEKGIGDGPAAPNVIYVLPVNGTERLTEQNVKSVGDQSQKLVTDGEDD